jgi:polysaccharide biosynthesis protein PslH
MHVLWIKSDYIDPPDSGGKIRTYNLLRQLRQLCEVTYLSLSDTKLQEDNKVDLPWASRAVTFHQAEEPKEGWRFYGRVLARMFSPEPYFVQKYRSRKIRNWQRNPLSSNSISCGKDDETVLVCDFLDMSGNVAWSTPYPKILFQHNVESVIWRRYFENERKRLHRAYFWFEHRRLKRYESNACNRFDMVITVSPKDKEVLQHDLGVVTPMKVIETGVDVEYFAPPQDAVPVPARLLFLGSLDWMPNIDGIDWFLRDVYPQIKARSPQVTLDLVGRRPTSAIRALVDGDSSLRVCGDVPDVRPYLAAADLCLVPLRIGSGTRLKIFEAMAMRCPVISTTVGAEGLPLKHDRHLLLADSAREFAEAVVSLLENPSKKQALAAEGHDFVTTNYSWKHVGRQLYDACLSVCAKTTT